jgi:lysophospholipase L1-like esterase
MRDVFTTDQTQHLLWRLTEGGELPASIHPDVVVVLIGTNNIHKHTVEAIALGIHENIDTIHKALPKSTILVNEIFPRHDRTAVKSNKTKSVNALNVLLKDLYVDHKATSPEGDVMISGSIQYLQCGSLFNPTVQQHADDENILVNVDLMPDKLHPNALGMKKWLTECVLPPALAAMTMK